MCVIRLGRDVLNSTLKKVSANIIVDKIHLIETFIRLI